jgi:hypothetical protein
MIKPRQNTADLSSTVLLVNTSSGDKYFRSCNYVKSSLAKSF